MIVVEGDGLNEQDLAFITRATVYTLDYLIGKDNPKYQDQIKVVIQVKKTLTYGRSYSATTADLGMREGLREFSIEIKQNNINRQGKKLLTQYRMFFMELMHELVHVRQYFSGDLEDIGDGGDACYYKGEIFRNLDMSVDEQYYEHPWEIDAYGRQQGLWVRFKKLIKEEVKEKQRVR